MEMEISVVSPANIALIKYWGKRDSNLILPLNDSLSVTVDALVAKTHVKTCSGTGSDKIILNGEELDLKKFPRISKCLNAFRDLLKVKGRDNAWHCEITSETNFPVSAGLASSSAGFAALAYALGQLFNLDVDETTRFARLGSGSACRSIHGGFVRWFAGTAADGSDCKCIQLNDKQHWPSLRAVVVVASDAPKEVSSTDGMQVTVETSELLKHRLANWVPAKIEELTAAIKEKNFALFGEIIMRESNQFHAVCLDSYPPLMYMTDASRHIIQIVHAYNKLHGKVMVAYTLDSGPNCFLFMEEQSLREFLPYICVYCTNTTEEKFIVGACPDIDRHLASRSPLENVPVLKDVVQYIIISKLGMAPHKV